MSDVVFHLETLRACVTGEQLLADDRLASLLVECMCWQYQRSHWHSRRPAYWQVRQRRAWLAEGSELFVDRDRLFATARECGLPVGG